MKGKKRISGFLAGLLLFAAVVAGTPAEILAAEGSEAEGVRTAVDRAVEATAAYVMEAVPEVEPGSVGGEWAVIGLARSLPGIPAAYGDAYYAKLESALKACNGELSANKYTEYSRLVLALTAIGKDPTDVAGYNLLEKIADYNAVVKQGVNGAVFALLALDCGDYEVPSIREGAVRTGRESLVAYLLGKEIAGGGFALSGNVPDADVTAQALQALAPYRDRADVAAAVERGLDALSALQQSSGGFGSWGTETAESTAQVLIALTTLGVDPATDRRFRKVDAEGNAGWLLPALLAFSTEEGGFRHIAGNPVNQMATEQALCGLAAYQRFLADKNSLYDMKSAAPTGHSVSWLLSKNSLVQRAMELRELEK